MSRIVIVGPSYPFRGGISHYTTLLTRSLAERHEVHLLSLSRQYPSLLFPGKTQTDESEVKLKVEGAERIVDSMNPISWLKAARRIERLRPDVVIIQWWHPFFAPSFGAIAWLCGRFTKVMFLCHNVLPHEKGGPVKLVTKAALGRGSLFIVHSEEDRTNLEALIPGARVMKTRHPTYEVFNENDGPGYPSRACEARAELDLRPDEKVILFFGLVREYKGLRYLTEAMPKVLSSMDATLLIAGEFYDDREKYVRQIKELGIEHRVRLRDEYIPNEKVGTFFSAADLVVLPYVSATQSGIVQIAYGFDKPVVTTNVGGLPEAVKDGETGYVVPPENPAALAEAILRFFREDRAEEFARNVAEFREEFSWSRMVEVIETLVGDQGGVSC